jgi:hypothetical protein
MAYWLELVVDIVGTPQIKRSHDGKFEGAIIIEINKIPVLEFTKTQVRDILNNLQNSQKPIRLLAVSEDKFVKLDYNPDSAPADWAEQLEASEV